MAEFPVHEPEDPVTFPVTFPLTPPLAVIRPEALTVVNDPAAAVVPPITALLIVPPEIVPVLMIGLVRVLFVSVSVVALPTSVSVEVGRVRVPVFEMEEITGLVSVLLVSVSAPAKEAKSALEQDVLNWAKVPARVLLARLTVLPVRVCVSSVVTSVLLVGIVVPLTVEEAVIAPVTASVPPTVALFVTAKPVPVDLVAEIVSDTPRVPRTAVLAKVEAPVTPRVPPIVALEVTASPVPEALVAEIVSDSVEAPVTPSVPPIVAFPVTGKLEAVPALITLDRVTFFNAVAGVS